MGRSASRGPEAWRPHVRFGGKHLLKALAGEDQRLLTPLESRLKRLALRDVIVVLSWGPHRMGKINARANTSRCSSQT